MREKEREKERERNSEIETDRQSWRVAVEEMGWAGFGAINI